MANVCTNIFYCQTNNTENLDIFENALTDAFSCDLYTRDEKCIQGEFYSKWTFPETFFDDLITKLHPDDSLYIRILSYEFGMEYAGFRIFKNNRWVIHM